MQLLRGSLSLGSLPLASSGPCPAPTTAPWREGALVFSKVGGLSFGLSLWDVLACLRVPCAWHACECACEQLRVPLVLL